MTFLIQLAKSAIKKLAARPGNFTYQLLGLTKVEEQEHARSHESTIRSPEETQNTWKKQYVCVYIYMHYINKYTIYIYIYNMYIYIYIYIYTQHIYIYIIYVLNRFDMFWMSSPVTKHEGLPV